jgi:hypothetical protein
MISKLKRRPRTVTVRANTKSLEIIVGSLSRCKREHTPLSVATAYQNEIARRCTHYAPFLPGPRVTGNV